METVNWQTLTQDAAKAGEPPTLGDHVARIIKAEYKSTKENHDPMVNVRWKIIAGVDEGKVVFDRFVFTRDNPNALFQQFGRARAIGLVPEQFPPQGGPALANLFTDIVATITVVMGDEYNGARKAEVSAYAAAPAGFGFSTPPVAVTPPLPAAAAPVAPPLPAPAPVAPVAAPPLPTVQAPTAPPPLPVAAPAPALRQTGPDGTVYELDAATNSWVVVPAEAAPAPATPTAPTAPPAPPKPF